MDLIIDNNIKKPFLRWTGSKRWFIKHHINQFLPKEFNNYHEPFLGGGSMFLFLQANHTTKRKYFLSDFNHELINCYVQLRDNPDAVIKLLKLYKNSEEEYYEVRNSKPRSNEKKAARFIYLNRTSFNGIYRVNSIGKYNVPYGKRENVDIVSEELLVSVSNSLQKVSIKATSFEKTLKNVKKNDLVFLDPPYTVAHENNGFIEYNQNLFSWNDQIKLKKFIDKIIKKEAYFILTNASHDSITSLYTNVGKMSTLTRACKVGGRIKTRGNFNELVVYNTVS